MKWANPFGGEAINVAFICRACARRITSRTESQSGRTLDGESGEECDTRPGGMVHLPHCREETHPRGHFPCSIEAGMCYALINAVNIGIHIPLQLFLLLHAELVLEILYTCLLFH